LFRKANTGRPPFVCAFGVPDIHETKTQMTQALHSSMLDEIASLRADLRRLIAEGTDIRENTVITRLAEFQSVRAKAQVYADLLGLRLDKMRAEIEERETQAHRLLMSEGSSSERKRRKSAKPQTVPIQSDMVADRDDLELMPLLQAAV
jgi:hypothetical protein